MRGTFRIIKYAVIDFWRNFWLSVVIITIFVLALLSFTCLFAFQYLSNIAIAQIQDRIDVGVYFQVSTTQQQLESIKGYIETLGQVKTVSVISAQDALQAFKEKHRNEPDLLQAVDELGENPLGPSLLVKAHDPKDYVFILSSLDDAPHKELIVDKNFDNHEIVLNRIVWAKSRIQFFMTTLAVFFLIVSGLVIFNTIRIAIYAKREEVMVMKLVGANNSFVRMPFIVISLLYAFMAMLVTLFIVFPLLAVLNPYMMAFFETSRLDMLQFFIDNFVFIFGTQLIGICIVSMLSAAFAVSRYLHI